MATSPLIASSCVSLCPDEALDLHPQSTETVPFPQSALQHCRGKLSRPTITPGTATKWFKAHFAAGRSGQLCKHKCIWPFLALLSAGHLLTWTKASRQRRNYEALSNLTASQESQRPGFYCLWCPPCLLVHSFPRCILHVQPICLLGTERAG